MAADEQNVEATQLATALLYKQVGFLPRDWAWLCLRAKEFGVSVPDIIHQMVSEQRERDRLLR